MGCIHACSISMPSSSSLVFHRRIRPGGLTLTERVGRGRVVKRRSARSAFLMGGHHRHDRPPATLSGVGHSVDSTVTVVEEVGEEEEEEEGAFVQVQGAFVRRTVAAIAAAVVTLSMVVAPSAQAGIFDAPEEKDPIEPFTVFGSVYKKYVIDVLDETGRKIVGRKKGFGAEACVDVISQSQQKYRVPGEGGYLAPGGPTSAAVAEAGVATGSYASTSMPVVIRSRFCEERFVQGSITKTDEMLPACVPACRSACSEGVDAYDANQRRTAGFGFTTKDESKVKGTCAARCTKECVKAGKAYDFIIPWRL